MISSYDTAWKQELEGITRQMDSLLVTPYKGEALGCFVCKHPASYNFNCRCGNFVLCSRACHDFLHYKKAFLEKHLAETRKWGLPSRMTLGEVMYAFRYFHFKCAYCQAASANTLDHFVPINVASYSHESWLMHGTEPCNIVPSCSECNLKKAEWFADNALANLFGSEAQERVLRFLEQQRVYQLARDMAFNRG